jgi:hypothetical protein
MSDQENRTPQQQSDKPKFGSEQKSGSQPNQPAQQKHDDRGTQPKSPQSEQEKRDQSKKQA